MPKQWDVGDRVKAVKQITESGKLPGNPEADPLDCDGIHAEAGEFGTVAHWHEGILPTVRFDRTGTATMVRDDEIELVPSEGIGPSTSSV